MILFDVPTIPLLRRVKLTSIAGSAICACEAEIDAVSATAAPAILAICPSPMTHVPSFALRARAQTHRVKTKPVTKDANEASGVSPASHAECRGRFPLTAFAPALPSPLRKTAPYGHPVHRLGDCAGRSPGSRVVTLLIRPSQFPSGRFGPKARRSQLRGQPRIASNSNAFHSISYVRMRSVRVPSFVPDLTRGTSTVKCSPEAIVKSRRKVRPFKIFECIEDYAPITKCFFRTCSVHRIVLVRSNRGFL